MTPKNQEILNQFKKALKGYQEPVGDHLWNDLQTVKVRKKKKFNRSYWVAIVGVVVVLLGFWLLWQYLEREGNKNPEVVSHDKTPEAIKKQEWIDAGGETQAFYDEAPFGYSEVQDSLIDAQERLDEKKEKQKKEDKKKKKTESEESRKKKEKEREEEDARKAKKKKQEIIAKINKQKENKEKNEPVFGSFDVSYSRDSTISYNLVSKKNNKLIFENKLVVYPSKVVISRKNNGEIVYTFLGFESEKDGRTSRRVIRGFKRNEDAFVENYLDAP